MFAGIVADILTKVLGDYVKNLNKDQLKIGIFGGILFNMIMLYCYRDMMILMYSVVMLLIIQEMSC